MEIHNFGGDAASVAIFGQSSGAGCVELLTRSPLSKGACGRGTVSVAAAAATTRIATARETVPRGRLLDKGSRHSAHGLRLHALAAFVPDRSLPRCDQPVRRLERQTTAVCTCDDRRTREAPELLGAYALQCSYDNRASHACTAANVSADSIGLHLLGLDHCGQAGMRVPMTVSAPSMLTRSFSLRHTAAARSSSAE